MKCSQIINELLFFSNNRNTKGGMLTRSEKAVLFTKVATDIEALDRCGVVWDDRIQPLRKETHDTTGLEACLFA